MTSATLKDKPVRDLARMAKQQGVPGWHSMRKDQLIKALVRRARAALDPTGGGARAVAPAARVGAADPEVARRIAEARERIARAKSLTTRPESGRATRPPRDRMVLMVRGPHWLHAFWEVTARSVTRAEAALGQDWHGSRPVLRLLRLETGLQVSASARVVREIEVHGGVKNWFIDVREPMRCRVELGYLAPSGRFHAVVRSNAVTVPSAAQGDTLDAHWGGMVADCDRIYAMSGGFSPENNSTELQELFEERLQRPMTPPARRPGGYEVETDEDDERPELQLQVDAEVIVYGATQPDARVTLQGEPVKLQPDGTFRVRVDMPNKRQVLPIIASAPDGGARHMVVMAVERNTKSISHGGRESTEL